jgi:Flp pilus assembly CpaE family ATPase
VAISLAAALGAVAPTVLVELDLCASAVAAYLDLDPTRNLCTLAHSVGDGARNWSVALGEELQPLQAAEPAAAQVLCGPPKREMRSTITPRMVDKLVGELARGNRWVILDVGPELQGLDVTPAAHRSALARADHLLVVSGSDLVSLWHARTLLDQFENLLEIERERVNLVLNRHDGRFHHSRDEIEWHLGAPVVGVVPFDQPAIQRAIADQRPVVVDRSSRAGRALQSLADRIIAAEKLRTGSPVAKQARGPWWQRLLIRRPRPTTWAPALRGQPLAALGSRRTGP